MSSNCCSFLTHQRGILSPAPTAPQSFQYAQFVHVHVLFPQEPKLDHGEGLFLLNCNSSPDSALSSSTSRDATVKEEGQRHQKHSTQRSVHFQKLAEFLTLNQQTGVNAAWEYEREGKGDYLNISTSTTITSSRNRKTPSKYETRLPPAPPTLLGQSAKSSYSGYALRVLGESQGSSSAPRATFLKWIGAR